MNEFSSLTNSSTFSAYSFGMTWHSSVKEENLEARPAQRYASDPMSELIKQRRKRIEHVVLSYNYCQLLFFRWLSHHSAAVKAKLHPCRNLFDPIGVIMIKNILNDFNNISLLNEFNKKKNKKFFKKHIASPLFGKNRLLLFEMLILLI